MPTLRALGLNCTLKPGDDPSSTDLLVTQVLDALAKEGVETDGPVRVADLDIKPGVRSDEGDGDEWPGLRRRILDADILVFGTPIWLGQPSSIAKRVTERMDAFLGETDDRGRMVSFDRVALVAVVGNEDGAHRLGRAVPGPERRRLHPPGQRRDLLGGRGDGQHRLQDLGRAREGHQRHHHGSLQRRPPRPAPARSRLPAGLIGRSALRARARPRPSPVETAGSDDHGTNLVSRCSTVGQPWRLVHRGGF